MRAMRNFRFFVAMLLAVACGPAFAQEQAFTNRGTELRERAAPEARVMANLPEGAPVTVVARSGGWTQVQAQGQTGWVRVFHLRFPASVQAAPASSGGGGFLGGLGNLIGGNRGKTEDTKIATIGIRGLSEEELRNASPNPEALRKLQSFRADAAGAERFAREAKLTAQRVAYPDEARK